MDIEKANAQATERMIEARPILVGLAHSCQQVEELPRDSWDVPLDAVVTAERILVIRRGSRDFLVGDCRNLPMLKQR